MHNGGSISITSRQRLRASLSSSIPRTIFIHGPAGVVNTEALAQTIPSIKNALQLDCVLQHNDRELFSAILGDRIPADPSILVSRLTSKKSPSPVLYAFTRAERLISSSFSASAVATILSLTSLVPQGVAGVILLSRLSWHAFRFQLSHSAPTPVEIFLPPYTETEIVDTIIANGYRMDTGDPEIAKKLYPAYVKSVVEVMYKTTTDLQELSAVCNQLFPEYMDKVCDENAIAAFNQIQHRLASALHSLYRRRLSISDLKSGGEKQGENNGRTVPSSENVKSDGAYETALSTAARTLIIAGFLASRNPPQHDLRYFAPERTRRTKSSKKKRQSQQDRVFPLERLLAIYASIAPSCLFLQHAPEAPLSVSASVSTSLLIHVSTLVSLGFFSRETGADSLSEPKFRSNTSTEYALRIADSLGIGLDHYLHIE